MPRSKKCKNPTSSERRNSRSFLSKLISVFRCSGKNSVRVQPTHISVRPAAATMDVRAGSQRPKTPLVFFSSSRPSTAVRPTTKGYSLPRTHQEPIRVSTPLASSSRQTGHNNIISISDMNASSGTPISVDRSVKVSASHLQGLSPSDCQATSATTASDAAHVSSGELLDIPRGPTYFGTNLSQLRKMQRHRMLEERRKREEMFGQRPRKVTFNPILKETLKPKKRVSEQIRNVEAAIKEMQQVLVEMDQDETQILKELRNWRMKIQRKEDYTTKDTQFFGAILTLEGHLSALKDCDRKIKNHLDFRKEKLAQLKVNYERLLLLAASGSTEEEVETKELLKQFLPTLGISPENFSITNLDSDDDFLNEDEDMALRPGSMNPVAAQLLEETSISTSQLHMHVQKPNTGRQSDILNEYHHTLKRKSTLSKKNVVGRREPKCNDGLKKFMQSQLQSGSKV